MEKFIALLALVFIATVIFLFSSQTYEEQTLVPLLQEVLHDQPLEGKLTRLKVPYGQGAVSMETHGYHGFIEFLIRKFAHLFLFGCLGAALFFVMVILTRMRVFLSAFLAFVVAGVYAILDEYHQMITGGRTPSFEDVLLDVTGAGIALIVLVPFYIWKGRGDRVETTRPKSV